MSTSEITPISATPTIAAVPRGREFTDLQAVCLFVVTGLFLTAALVALGFGADIAQGLTS
jgi:hypothetical protein